MQKSTTVRSHLKKWHATKPASSESAEEIRRIVNAIKNLIEGMNNPKRTPISDDIFVFYTVERLDTNTRRAWESSLGATKDSATFKSLRTFGSEEKSRSRPTACPIAEINELLFQLCQGQNHIHGCTAFKTKSVPERIAFVKARSLCKNCLGLHKTSACKSSKNCFVCSGRHNTTLHRDATSNVSTNLATTTGDRPIFSDLLATIAAVSCVGERWDFVRACVATHRACWHCSSGQQTALYPSVDRPVSALLHNKRTSSRESTVASSCRRHCCQWSNFCIRSGVRNVWNRNATLSFCLVSPITSHPIGDSGLIWKDFHSRTITVTNPERSTWFLDQPATLKSFSARFESLTTTNLWRQ